MPALTPKGSEAGPPGYAPGSSDLEACMLSVCTADLQVTLLRHQNIVDRNIQDDAERQHVVDTGKSIAPQPLIDRAHIRYAQHPSHIRYGIPAASDQTP